MVPVGINLQGMVVAKSSGETVYEEHPPQTTTPQGMFYSSKQEIRYAKFSYDRTDF